MSDGKNSPPPNLGGGGAPAGGCVAPCPAAPPATPVVVGTPAPIPPGDDSIVCRGGALTTQINDTGPDRACTVAHEETHIADWKGRYGENLCVGVADGSLPLGGPGYDAFIKQSECKAYRVGKACREKAILTAADADKPRIQAGIDRDNDQIAANCN